MPRIVYKCKDGKRVSGVTTVNANLGWNTRPLLIWANQCGLDEKTLEEARSEAMDIGTIAHEMIEMDVRCKEFDATKYDPELVEKANVCFEAWLEWKKLVEFEMVVSEKSLVSEEHRFGGTVDIVARIKGRLCILDLKTSKGGAIYPESKIQIAAYGKLYEEVIGDKIEAYYLLALGKTDASFHYHYWPTLKNEWICFKHLLAIHSLKKIIK